MPKTRAMARRAALLCALSLLALIAAQGAGAYRLLGGRWPTATVPYYVEIPAYAWSVDAAAYSWNASGARVRFVRVPRAQAKVLIGIRWYRAAGDARPHRVGNRIVSAKVGIRSGQDRYTMALVMAHELGHVLGLDHEDRTCAIMNSHLAGDHSEKCPAPPSGSWVCRLLQPDDVRGAVALYGGTVRPYRGPESCPK